jgi:ABC-type multidrug transport system fused ATPase/permease subunit
VTSWLFASMIRDAIAYSRPDGSDAEVEAAAREDRDERRLPGSALAVVERLARDLTGRRP